MALLTRSLHLTHSKAIRSQPGTSPEMLSRRLVTLRPLFFQCKRNTAPRLASSPCRYASSHYNEPALGRDGVDSSLTDPNMNGGYVNPPALKRALRDPYADWWDKQERRNFGEPVHEDNDILGVFSTEPYTHAKPAQAWLSFGAFVAATLGLCTVVYQYYPDKPSTPRTFPDGLSTELGGTRAALARKPDQDSY